MAKTISQNIQHLEKELPQLEAMALSELRKRWVDLLGKPAPASFRRTFLALALAHQMRIKISGGLSPAIKQRLRQIAEAARDGKSAAPHLIPGTKLLREWQGKTYSVRVLENGFEWNGQNYGSLSTIAEAITGTRWNGWVFFGIKRRPSRNKNAAKQKGSHHG